MAGKWTLEKALENLPVKIIALGAALLLFVFHRIDVMGKLDLTLPVELAVDPGYVPREVVNLRASLTIRGEKRTIDSIQASDLRVVAQSAQPSGEGEVVIPLNVIRQGVAADTEGLDIMVDPAEIRVYLERKDSRIVDVQPLTSGQPAPGFTLASVKVTPDRVVIVGPRSRIKNYDVLQTEKTDLTGMTVSEDRVVQIQNPDPAVSILSGPRATMEIRISGNKSAREFVEIPVRIRGLARDLALLEPLPPVTFVVSAPEDTIKALKSETLVPEIDMTGLILEGVYDRPVEITVPPEVTVESIVPPSLRIEVGSRP